eukprot:751939-Hanusia_phi.AAC.2
MRLFASRRRVRDVFFCSQHLLASPSSLSHLDSVDDRQGSFVSLLTVRPYPPSPLKSPLLSPACTKKAPASAACRFATARLPQPSRTSSDEVQREQGGGRREKGEGARRREKEGGARSREESLHACYVHSNFISKRILREVEALQQE